MSTDAQIPEGATAPGAYGLAISSDAGLPGLAGASGAAPERRAAHRVVRAGQLAAYTAGPRRTLGGDGAGRLRVEYHEHRAGTMIRTASLGDHLVAGRGRTVLSAVEGVDPELWRRYVLGQVLPLAASVQGLEIFHAGAVSADGSAIALAGPSGAGKSTLTAALVEAGSGELFADDVLAIEPGPSGPLAYPGACLTSVVAGARRALPVAAFFLLVPDPEASRVGFAPCPAERLLASTFDGLSRDRERLLRLLGVAATLAAAGAEELRYRPGSDPREVAAALLARLAARSDGG